MVERLVILGSTLTALAMVRDAHAHRLEAIVVDTTQGIAFRSRYAQACLADGAKDDAAVLETLLVQAGSSSALVATGDPWLRFVIRQRATLRTRFDTVLHADNAVLETCLDKRRFAAWCTANGLDTPRSWLAGEESRPPGLTPPFLVRPAQTLHGRPNVGLPKAAEVGSESELADLLERFARARCPALVSESLLGRRITQYSVPFACGPAGLLAFVARKVRPAPDRCSIGTFVELYPQPEVERLALRAVRTLGYFGIGEVEILRDEDSGRTCLIEINARPWLQYALAPASGHDFLGLLLGTTGERSRTVTRGRRWIDLRSDLFAAFSSSEGAVRRGEMGLLAYLGSVLRANVFARFDWRDPGPAFARDTVTGLPAPRVEDTAVRRS